MIVYYVDGDTCVEGDLSFMTDEDGSNVLIFDTNWRKGVKRHISLKNVTLLHIGMLTFIVKFQDKMFRFYFDLPSFIDNTYEWKLPKELVGSV
jgi:hypothetical protein